MHVYDITRESFNKFADDVLRRLDDTSALLRPTVWMPVGNSGDAVTQAIIERRALAPRPWHDQVAIVDLGWDPDNQVHQLQDPNSAAYLKDAAVLLIDSVVNSGTTILSAVEFLQKMNGGPRSITIYAVAVRRGSDVIPNIFSISIGASDRVFLPWHEQRPNSRLTMGCVYRALRESDNDRPAINTKQQFINRVEWRDRWYSLKREPQQRIIVCEDGNTIQSFVSFKTDLEYADVHVDEVATDIRHERKGIAGALLRYVETLARADGCRTMSLWSHDSVVQYYQKMGFEKAGPAMSCGVDGGYALMKRQLGSSKAELAVWTQTMCKSESAQPPESVPTVSGSRLIESNGAQSADIMAPTPPRSLDDTGATPKQI